MVGAANQQTDWRQPNGCRSRNPTRSSDLHFVDLKMLVSEVTVPCQTLHFSPSMTRMGIHQWHGFPHGQMTKLGQITRTISPGDLDLDSLQQRQGCSVRQQKLEHRSQRHLFHFIFLFLSSDQGPSMDQYGQSGPFGTYGVTKWTPKSVTCIPMHRKLVAKSISVVLRLRPKHNQADVSSFLDTLAEALWTQSSVLHWTGLKVALKTMFLPLIRRLVKKAGGRGELL